MKGLFFISLIKNVNRIPKAFLFFYIFAFSIGFGPVLFSRVVDRRVALRRQRRVLPHGVEGVGRLDRRRLRLVLHLSTRKGTFHLR